jgi:hypothetical protein
MELPPSDCRASIPSPRFSSRIALGGGPRVEAHAGIAAAGAGITVVLAALAWAGAAAVTGNGTVYETSSEGALSAPEVL